MLDILTAPSIVNSSTLSQVEQRLKYAKRLAIDVETSGLSWKTNETVGYVLTFDDGEFYVPVRHAGGSNVSDGDRIEFERLLSRYAKLRGDLLWIMHNASFDLRFLARHGIHIDGPVHDTMVAAALIDENAKSFSLETWAKRAGAEHKQTDIYTYLAAQFGGNPTKNQMSNYYKLPGDDPLAVSYALTDGRATLQLYDWCLKEISAQELEKVWSVEAQLTKVLHDITWKGVRVDEQKLAQVRLEIETRLEAALAKLPPDLNSRSPLAMEKLFRDAAIADWPTTKTGRPSFPESWLKNSELGRTVIDARKWRTVLSAYIAPLQQEHLHNGRVHTSFHQLRGDEYGTVTGRLSCTSPNLQAVPSPSRNPEIAALYRSVFVPDQGEFGEADYRAAEIRICTHYSQARTWLRGFNSKPEVDPHTSVAQALGISRRHAKTIGLGLMTGMGQAKLSQDLGLPLEQGKAVIAKFFEGNPEVKTFYKRATAVAETRGFVHTLLGRRCRFPDGRFAYRALNRLVQGGSADCTKLKMVELHRYFSERNNGRLLLSVHDSLEWEAWEPDVHGEVKEILECFRGDCLIHLKCPMTVDLGHGPDWAIAGQKS